MEKRHKSWRQIESPWKLSSFVKFRWLRAETVAATPRAVPRQTQFDGTSRPFAPPTLQATRCLQATVNIQQSVQRQQQTFDKVSGGNSKHSTKYLEATWNILLISGNGGTFYSRQLIGYLSRNLFDQIDLTRYAPRRTVVTRGNEMFIARRKPANTMASNLKWLFHRHDGSGGNTKAHTLPFSGRASEKGFESLCQRNRSTL